MFTYKNVETKTIYIICIKFTGYQLQWEIQVTNM